MFAGSGVLRLLNDDRLVAVHLLRDREGRRQRGVSGGPPVESFDDRQGFRHVEDFALRDGDIPVHIAQRTRRVSGNVRPVRPRGEGNSKPGVSGRERFPVEVAIAGHVKAGEIDAGADNSGLRRSDLSESARRAGQISAAGVRSDNGVRELPLAFQKLLGDLRAQRLDPGDAEGRIERGVEEACFLQNKKEVVEKLRSDGHLQDFRAVRFALSSLLENLRLTDAATVEKFLENDAFEVAHIRLGRDGRSVVSACGCDHAFIAPLFRVIAGDGGPAVLKTAGGVARFVLEEDPSPLALRSERPGCSGQVFQLDERRIPDIRLGLDHFDFIEGIPGLSHHFLVVERNPAEFKFAVIESKSAFHDLDFPGHDLLIARIRHCASPFAMRLRSSFPTSSSSGIGRPNP